MRSSDALLCSALPRQSSVHHITSHHIRNSTVWHSNTRVRAPRFDANGGTRGDATRAALLRAIQLAAPRRAAPHGAARRGLHTDTEATRRDSINHSLATGVEWSVGIIWSELHVSDSTSFICDYTVLFCTVLYSRIRYDSKDSTVYILCALPNTVYRTAERTNT